ncbi:hypothetical protein Rsub_05726 [Raphidocelis subcapitata]|uniref:CDAN1-interacting nuclease 1 n=1 Tax=Raphidocelis subcapitata TaxID=307507 RepID=A0A2V0P4W0_9CHLO|nr:hypothetical protein Rsub_05726 [Raphidocelis subcapitata]|eukprot:GBF92890.1 hypothetical protein Rsub_05726 [Raphidocelis subcapitata]
MGVAADRCPGAISREEYAALVAKLDAVPSLACPNFRLLRAQHPCVPPPTLLGLFSQEAQNRVIRTHHLHKANMASHCARYRAGVDVLEICAAADFPACLMMRRMLEHMLGLSKQRVSDVVKDPSLLTAALVGDAAAGEAGAALLARLRADVVRCARADRSYSPYSDMAKTLAGLEHEAALYATLREAGVPHWSEQELRDKGMYKTPDALLQVPIAVRCPLTERWHIVHWIDSKASFGDDRLHAQALEGQYRTYLNRYGSGAVIYWFGFVRDLAQPGDTAAGSDGGGWEGGAGGGGGMAGGGGGGAGSGAAEAGEVLLLDRFPGPGEVRLLS